MCWEVCGLDVDATPAEIEAYEAWLDSLYESEEEVSPESDEAEEAEESYEVLVISEHESYQRFDDFLNELYATVRVCGYDYDPARVLKEIDPVAYREEYNNWLDNELNEGSFKLEQDL